MDKCFLTPNERLARNLLTSSAKQTCWAPKIFSIASYLKQAFLTQTLFSKQVLVSKPALVAFFEDLSLDAPVLVKTPALHQALFRAYQTLLEWQIDWQQITPENASQAYFLDVMAQIPRHWVAEAGLMGAARALAPPTDHMVLTCFTEKTPALNALVEAWQSHTTVEFATRQRHNPVYHHYAAADEDDELTQAALWAKRQLENGAIKIGIVAPEVQTARDVIYQRFFEILHPDLLGVTCAIDALDFNISAGISLAAHPIVAAAFAIWFNEPDLYATTPKRHNPPGKRSFTEWTTVAWQLLEDAGFAESRQLSSNEYQALMRLKRFMVEISPAFFNQSLSFQTWLQRLVREAHRVQFQPESKNERVQILGPLEALGQSFDALWVMGCSKTAWPPKVAPSPFIPLSLQQSQGMPHGSSARQLAFTERLFDDLLTASDTIVTSAVGAPVQYVQADVYFPLDVPVSTSIPMVSYQQKGAPFNESDLKGGAYALKLQLACPFRAYMETRLNLAQDEQEYLGVPPKVRGQILHECLAQQTTCPKKIAQAFGVLKLSEQDLQLEVAAMQKALANWQKVEETLPRMARKAEVPLTLTLNRLTISLRADRIDNDKIVYDYKMRAPSKIFEEVQLPLYALAINADAVAYYEVNADKAFIKGQGAPFSKDDFEAIKQEWHEQLTELVQSYQQGDVTRKCASPCHLTNVCRIYE